MSRRPVPWWHSPQTVISLLLGFGSIGWWVISQFVSEAKQETRLDDEAKHVETLEGEVKSDEVKVQEAATQYQLIQKDIANIEKEQQQILEALKKR